MDNDKKRRKGGATAPQERGGRGKSAPSRDSRTPETESIDDILGSDDILTGDDVLTGGDVDEAGLDVAAMQEWIETRIEVPDSINEEYYQISPEILDCFPKFRFPLDLYRFKEDIASLAPVYQAGDRVDGNTRARIYNMCREGFVFVSRQQHEIYTNFISRQVDMVLLDTNLKPNEIAEIFAKCFIDAISSFYSRPLPDELNNLKHKIDVFIEYLSEDMSRINEFVCQLHREHAMEFKGINVAFMALGLYVKYYGSRVKIEVLARATLGFLLHDVGMSKIPVFVTDNDRPLRVDERRRVQEHTSDGADLLIHMGVMDDEVLLPILEHHERMDGSGYPRRLKGNDISMIGRITGVADSYCAMITERPFTAEKKPIQAAVELLKDQQGYDPRITTLLVKMLQEISC